MRRAFISYSRSSEGAVQHIRDDLLRSGIDEVWWDKHLIGAQSWWETILHQIREADVVVCLVDVGIQESLAVRREYQYAVSLGKPLLPILLSSDINITTLPVEISGRQYVDYRKENVERSTRMVEALGNLPPTPQLPNPLPHAPEMPRSERDYLVERASSTEPLSEEIQNAVLNQLRRLHRSEDSEQREFATHWLTKMRERRELYASVATDIDELNLNKRKSPTGKIAAFVAIALSTSVLAFLLYNNDVPTEETKPNTNSLAPDAKNSSTVDAEMPVDEILPIEQVDREMQKPNEATAAVDSMEIETASAVVPAVRWVRDFTVFEERSFSLCGFQDFNATAEKSGGTDTSLRLRSTDRSIPDQPFRGFDQQVLTNKITELFPDCQVLFDHEVTANVARIRVRVKGNE